MVAVSRKKPAAVIRTKASKPKEPIDWRRFIKPFIGLLIAISGLLVYVNWADLLAGLDKTPIKSYALTHQTRFTTNKDVREVLSKEPALQGYFAQDIQDVKQRFLTLPWVKDAVVRKVYPDRLGITLIEHQPFARWNNEKLLSDQGVVFSLPPDRLNVEDLPLLFGPDSEGKVVLEAWHKIKQDLKLRNLTPRAIEMDNRGAWTITLDNGVSLRLGRGDWLPKIDRFVAIFPQIDVPNEMRLAYVDLRYDNGAAVGFTKK